MNKDVIEFLENQKLFSWYFNHRNCILLLVILFSTVASVYMGRKVIRAVGKIDCKEICGKSFGHFVIIVFLGTGLNAAGMEFEFAINLMPILLFTGAVLITLGIQIVEFIRYYKNCGEVINRTNIICIGIMECAVLLLAIMGRLEVVELLAAGIVCITLKMANVFMTTCIRTRFKYKINTNTLMKDCPVSQERDLFESRKRQLDSLCKELDKFCGEPYAVAISGKWGSGKTSFVNALKEKLSEAEFVNVECSIEYDIKAVLKDITSQIQEIYRRNNVYVGKNGVINKYFKKIGEFVDNAGYGGMAKIIDTFQIEEKSSFWENKAAMNKALDKFYGLTGKHIYFIVDDMDRIISDEMRAVLF